MRSMEAELRALRNELSNRNGSKNHTETQIDIQVEIEEQQPSAFQGEFKNIKKCGKMIFHFSNITGSAVRN